MNFEAKYWKLRKYVPPFCLAAVVCCAIVAMYYPWYLQLTHLPRQSNGHPDWDKRFQTALDYDAAGNKIGADRLYQKIIAAAGSPQGCPGLVGSKTQGYSLKARAYVALGMMRSYRGRYNEALAAYRAGERMAPQDAIQVFYLGYGLSKVGRVEEAKAAFRRASTLYHGDIKKDAEAALQAL